MAAINEFVRDLTKWADQTDEFNGEVELYNENDPLYSLTVRYNPNTVEITERKQWHRGKWAPVASVGINEDAFLRVFSILFSERMKQFKIDDQHKRWREEQETCMKFEKKTINRFGSMAGY